MRPEELNFLVDQYLVKVAEYTMKDIRAKELNWLEPEDQKLLFIKTWVGKLRRRKSRRNKFN